MTKRLLTSAVVALAVAAPASAQAAATEPGPATESPSSITLERQQSKLAKSKAARQCAKLRRRGRRCTKRRRVVTPRRPSRPTPTPSAEREPGTTGVPGPVSDIHPVMHHDQQIANYTYISDGRGGTTPIYTPIPVSTLGTAAGPLVGRSPAIAGDQIVVMQYIVQKLVGSQWFNVTQANGSGTITGGATSVRMPYLSISPNGGPDLRVVELIGWGAVGGDGTIFGSREFVPQHACASPPRRCSAPGGGYVHLSA